MWHARMGNPGENVIDDLIKYEHVIVTDVASNIKVTISDACVKGKTIRRSFPNDERRNAKAKMDLVHSDLCGPLSVPSLGGAKYFIIFVDDATRMTLFAFLKNKTQILDVIKSCVSLMSTQGHGVVKALRTDNGSE